MGLLADLIAETESRPIANPAKVANPAPAAVQDSQIRKIRKPSDSVGTPGRAPDTRAIRDRLLVLSAAEYRDPALVRAASESFLRDCDGMGNDALRALLSMLADDADRQALRRPVDDTAAILCRKCGLVWVHPSIASVLPVVGGWPRALGCPWCFVPKDGRLAISRPPVTCGTCQHFIRDTVNAPGGMGSCAIGVATKPPKYPFTTQHCCQWRPIPSTGENTDETETA